MKKTSRGEKSNFRGKFGISKIVKLVGSGDRQIQKFFLIDFDIWNVKIRVRMRKFLLFYEQTLNKRTKRSESGKNLRQCLRIDGKGGEKHTNSTLQTLKLKYAKARLM